MGIDIILQIGMLLTSLFGLYVALRNRLDNKTEAIINLLIENEKRHSKNESNIAEIKKSSKQSEVHLSQKIIGVKKEIMIIRKMLYEKFNY